MMDEKCTESNCIYYEICKDYKDMECVHKETLALTEWLKEMKRGYNGEI